MKDFEKFAFQILSESNLEEMKRTWNAKSDRQGELDNIEYIADIILKILWDYHEWISKDD